MSKCNQYPHIILTNYCKLKIYILTRRCVHHVQTMSIFLANNVLDMDQLHCYVIYKLSKTHRMDQRGSRTILNNLYTVFLQIIYFLDELVYM